MRGKVKGDLVISIRQWVRKIRIMTGLTPMNIFTRKILTNVESYGARKGNESMGI